MDEEKIFELAELLADEAFGKKGVIYYAERQELSSLFNKILVKKLTKPDVRAKCCDTCIHDGNQHLYPSGCTGCGGNGELINWKAKQ